MNRKFSKYFIILIVVGIVIAYMAFPPINIDFWVGGEYSLALVSIQQA